LALFLSLNKRLRFGALLLLIKAMAIWRSFIAE
jgi:hypothetical protein